MLINDQGQQQQHQGQFQDGECGVGTQTQRFALI